MRAYLEISQIGGIINLPLKQTTFYIGKDEIKSVASKSLPDPKAYESISRVQRDPKGNVIKEHFLLNNSNGSFTIEDRHSTNGTYIGSTNLKGAKPYKLKDGDQIILPVQEKGKLISLIIVFHLSNELEVELEEDSRAEYHEPHYEVKSANISSNLNANASQPEYNPIPTADQRIYSTPSGVKSVSIPAGGASSVQPADVDDVDRSGSFILVQQDFQVPPNAFRPDSGVDLSMVYKLEKSERWHILVALCLLFLMIWHTYLNIMIITFLVSLGEGTAYTYVINGYQLFYSDFIFQPIGLAFLFAITFVIHELSHLYTGKHFGFQSRFCLTNVGYKFTKRSAEWGIPLGLPGAAVSVGVDPVKDRDKMGWIKFAGPASNAILGCIFLIIALLLPSTLLTIRSYLMEGSSLNFLLGTFNLLPFAIKGFALDGEFISKWNKKYYFAILLFNLIGILISLFLTMMLS
jgi:hypothetical protein